MFKFQKKLFTLFCLASLLGCIQDVQINTESSDPEIVLNSILEAGKDTIFVYLSYTKPIQSGQNFEPIENAQIILSENDETIGTFIWKDSSCYFLPLTIEPERSYRITANNGNKTVWGETTVPKSVEASIEKIQPTNYLDPFLISFYDSKEENYYWVSATGYEGAIDNRIKNIACSLYSNFAYADDFNQRIAQNGVYHFEYDFYLRFNDNEIRDSELEIEFSPQCISYPKQIYLLSVDYQLDKYMKSSLILEDMSEYSEDMPIIYAPFPTYSNVHGGTGIVGSYSSVSKVFTKD